MPLAPARRAQTTKQAKAAFKARGATYVSPAEQKRLERGAELQRRAEKAKFVEGKRKEWLKKKEAEDDKDKKGDVALGSQRKLDKFGYASSQFHLGRFFTKGRIVSTTEDERLEDRADAQANVQAADRATEDAASPEEAEAGEESSPATSPVDMSDFLESNTQITKELDSPKKRRPFTSFTSFGSEEGLFDEATLSHLDRVAEELELSRSQSPVKEDANVDGEDDAAQWPPLIAGPHGAFAKTAPPSVQSPAPPSMARPPPPRVVSRDPLTTMGPPSALTRNRVAGVQRSAGQQAAARSMLPPSQTRSNAFNNTRPTIPQCKKISPGPSSKPDQRTMLPPSRPPMRHERSAAGVKRTLPVQQVHVPNKRPTNAWSTDENAGFSMADLEQLVDQPVVFTQMP